MNKCKSKIEASGSEVFAFYLFALNAFSRLLNLVEKGIRWNLLSSFDTNRIFVNNLDPTQSDWTSYLGLDPNYLELHLNL